MVAKDESFVLVGAGQQVLVAERQRPSFLQRLKRGPWLSGGLLLLIILGCIFAPLIANHDPSAYYLQALNRSPDGEFYFGTDSLGRDLFSIMFYGGRTSIAIGLMGAALIAFIGISYGTLSGIASDMVDSLLMRLTEMGGSIPQLLLVLILTAVIPAKNIFTMSFIIGITGWFGLARIVRSEVRQIRNSEYVLYARCTSGGFFYVMWRHLLPNFLSATMFVIVSNISTSITMESTLSFLGLGLPVDVLSWGCMLSLANKALILNTWWVIVIPGVFLVVTLLCITSLANYLRKETNRRPSIL